MIDGGYLLLTDPDEKMSMVSSALKITRLKHLKSCRKR